MNPVIKTMRLFAGSMITGSLTLANITSPYWLLLTLFVGLNMIQSSINKWCFDEEMIKKYNLNCKNKPSLLLARI